MKIVYESSLNTMIIDPTSAKVLELLINLANPKSNDTLFGAINRTKTRSGYVILRSSILQASFFHSFNSNGNTNVICITALYRPVFNQHSTRHGGSSV